MMYASVFDMFCYVFYENDYVYCIASISRFMNLHCSI